MIIVPKNSSITSLVAQNHSNFREMLDLLIKIYDLSQSNDPLELRLSKTLMDVNGIEDEYQLETYISIYDDFLDMEKDMLYEMFDLYIKYVPGHTWN